MLARFISGDGWERLIDVSEPSPPYWEVAARMPSFRFDNGDMPPRCERRIFIKRELRIAEQHDRIVQVTDPEFRGGHNEIVYLESDAPEENLRPQQITRASRLMAHLDELAKKDARIRELEKLLAGAARVIADV